MGPDVTAVVGGQFGSEGKGLIVGRIAEDFTHHVRVGAANAGHTLWTTGNGNPGGQQKHVMQQLPCAAYANPLARLYVGPGALISPEILDREINDLYSWRRQNGGEMIDILVDPRAHVITEGHIARESASGLDERIGSTSTIAREGIGSAQAARVMREESCVPAGEYFVLDHGGVRIADVPTRLALENGGILLEGTQGYGLSLTTGDFPYVTSRNTTAAGLAADCGVAPNRLERVILVVRTYPIRVAGNSGPFHRDSVEIDWSALDVDPESERTTVTKKIRRVATFSLEQVVDAAMVNGATEIALTFCDYLDRRLEGADSRKSGTWTSLNAYPGVEELVNNIEHYTGVPVTMLGTGPKSVLFIERSRR